LICEQQPNTSFVFAKSAIESLHADGPAITVQTNEATRHRSGEVRRLSFRVVSGADPAPVTSWYGGGMEYQAIKETKLSNPYELEIKPFTGDSYKFHFDGVGMDASAYREWVDRVTSARASR
jgi:hypothetical protein